MNKDIKGVVLQSGDFVIVGNTPQSINQTINGCCPLKLQFIGFLDGKYYCKNSVGTVSSWPSAILTTAPDSAVPKIEMRIKIDGKLVQIKRYEFRSSWFQVDFNHKDFPKLQRISGYSTDYKK